MAIVAAFVASISVAQAGVLVSDGDFTSWSSFSFVTDDPTVVTPGPGTSTGSAVTVPTGGNPGAYLSLTETFTTGDTIWTGGIKTDYTYDPATQGALTSLGIKVDLRDPTFGATRATAWLLVVSQGGKRYYSVPFNAYTNSSILASFSENDLTSASFDTNPWAGNFGVKPDGQSPDFSSSGTPLEFGFMIGNRVVGFGTLANTVGMDDFVISEAGPEAGPANVPEPSALLLLATSVVVAGCVGRLVGKV